MYIEESFDRFNMVMGGGVQRENRQWTRGLNREANYIIHCVRTSLTFYVLLLLSILSNDINYNYFWVTI